MPGDILVKVDRASMLASLEVRCPLLDHVVFEFVSKIPPKYKMNLVDSKIIFKKALGDLLPLSYIGAINVVLRFPWRSGSPVHWDHFYRIHCLTLMLIPGISLRKSGCQTHPWTYRRAGQSHGASMGAVMLRVMGLRLLINYFWFLISYGIYTRLEASYAGIILYRYFNVRRRRAPTCTIDHSSGSKFLWAVCSLFARWTRGISLHFAPELQAANVPLRIFNLKWQPVDIIRAMINTVATTWQIRPHILHAVNHHSNHVTRLIRPFLPQSLQLITAVPTEFNKRQLLYERIEQYGCDAIVCKSLYLQEKIIQESHIPAKKVYCIPNGLDIEKFGQNKTPNFRSLIAPSASRVLVMLGRISNKNLPTCWFKLLVCLSTANNFLLNCACLS